MVVSCVATGEPDLVVVVISCVAAGEPVSVIVEVSCMCVVDLI